MKSAPIASFFAVLLTSQLAHAAGTVAISVSLSPAGSFVAKSESVQGTATKSGNGYTAQGVNLDLNTLKTGIDLRDRHMRDKYFETKKYPKATLKSAKAEGGKFEAELEVHGKTKKVSGPYEVQGQMIQGKFKTTLSDFGIPDAKYMGVGVDDEVEVEVKLPLAAAGAPTGAKK
jgi:polyisoprenoid-binding protein YceI